MGKRDEFARNIKAITNTKSLKKAIQDWEILQCIELSRNKHKQACELCHTPFRKGAIIRYSKASRKNAATISVGGTCLETIVRGSFANKEFVSKRKSEVHKQLKQLYYGLVSDSGSWLKWLSVHVPTRLKPLAAQLELMGMVNTDVELGRLIKFHDANRKYQADALLPMSMRLAKSLSIPPLLTIDQARSIITEMSLQDWSKILLEMGNAYRFQNMAGICFEDPIWRAHWKKQTPRVRRAITSLAKLTDDLTKDTSINVDTLATLLRPIKTHGLPFFAWSKKGLAWIENLVDDVGERAEVWLWADEKWHEVELSDCYALVDLTESEVLKLEAMAFWTVSPWIKEQAEGFRQKLNRPIKRESKKRIEQPVASTSQVELRKLPCVTALLKIAEFQGHQELADQVSWLKQRLRSLGCEWTDFIWQAERYSSSLDCKWKIDSLTQRISMTTRL